MEDKNRKISVLPIICVLIGCVIVISIMYITFEDTMLPIKEGHNAKIAYTYHNEKTGCNGLSCGPSCSLEARMFIDEYRQDHNLTHERFLCAVWFNDMNDWFYY